MPKLECTAHIGSRKVLLKCKEGYSRLLLLVVTMQSRLVHTCIQGTRSYHVCLPRVVSHKGKPQIDSTHRVRNRHIQGGEKLKPLLVI